MYLSHVATDVDGLVSPAGTEDRHHQLAGVALEDKEKHQAMSVVIGTE